MRGEESLNEWRCAVRHARDCESRSSLAPWPREVYRAVVFMFLRCEYMDNLRIARTTDLESVGRYEAAQIRGCCGEIDKEIMVNGELWKVGCNFGH